MMRPIGEILVTVLGRMSRGEVPYDPPRIKCWLTDPPAARRRARAVRQKQNR